jgi:hypothetical protein
MDDDELTVEVKTQNASDKLLGSCIHFVEDKMHHGDIDPKEHDLIVSHIGRMAGM